MKTPPEMLTGKDCSYLSDLLETSLTLAKKANSYSNDIEDAQCKKALNKDAKTLVAHYHALLNLLK